MARIPNGSFESKQTANVGGFDVDVIIEYDAHLEDDTCDTDRGQMEGSHNEVDKVTAISPDGDLTEQIKKQMDDIPADMRDFLCSLVVTHIEKLCEKNDPSLMDEAQLNDDCDDEEID